MSSPDAEEAWEDVLLGRVGPRDELVLRVIRSAFDVAKRSGSASMAAMELATLYGSPYALLDPPPVGILAGEPRDGETVGQLLGLPIVVTSDLEHLSGPIVMAQPRMTWVEPKPTPKEAPHE